MSWPIELYQRSGERLDKLEDSNRVVLQKPKSFCFGMDAVLLSQLTKLKATDFICEFGTGSGVIPLVLSGRRNDVKIIALEIQREMAEMAQRSVFLNGMQNQISIIEADFCQASALFGTAIFDLVITNPPYRSLNRGLINPVHEKAVARHEMQAELEKWVKEVARILKPKGRLTMVYRPQRLAELISVLKANQLEPKRMILIQSKSNRAPYLVFLESVKDANPELIVERPLIIYQKTGEYTDELWNLYRGGGRIEESH